MGHSENKRKAKFYAITARGRTQLDLTEKQVLEVVRPLALPVTLTAGQTAH